MFNPHYSQQVKSAIQLWFSTNGNKTPAPRKDSNLHTSLIDGNRSIEGQKQVHAPQKLACRIEQLKKLINKLRVSIWLLGPEDIDDKMNQEKYTHLVTYATDVDCGCQRLSCGWWYNPAMYSWLKQPASNCILALLLFTHYVLMQHDLLDAGEYQTDVNKCSLVGLPICFFSLTKMWTIMSRILAASHNYYAQPLFYFNLTDLMGIYVWPPFPCSMVPAAQKTNLLREAPQNRKSVVP